jgi:riboflavin-specific deaminase-like protein
MTGIRPLRPEPVGLDEDALVGAYATDRARPWLRLNFVASLDGAVTTGDGYSAGLSGKADKRVFGILRMICDALMVGAGTLRHEKYDALRLSARQREWRRAHGLAEYPTLVVVSRSLDLDPTSSAFAEAPVRPVVLTTEVAPIDRREAFTDVAHVLVYGAIDVDLAAALDVLRSMGLGQVLCEGGPHVLAALTAADLVDELCLTIAPLLVGPGPGRITAGPPPVPQSATTPRGLRLHHALTADDGALILRYVRL